MYSLETCSATSLCLSKSIFAFVFMFEIQFNRPLTRTIEKVKTIRPEMDLFIPPIDEYINQLQNAEKG